MKTVEPLFRVAQRFKPSQEVYSTGYTEFDKAMDGGVRDGELIVISGQTGSGKTTYAQCLSVNFDKKKVPTLWFSFEMNPWYLKEKFEKMGMDYNMLAYSPIELISSELNFISTEIDEAVKDYACKVIFIDHLHYLIPLADSKNSSLMIGGIVREIKKMAIRKNIVVFLISHTKKVYDGEKLSLSSIRDSSLVAQESDFVFLVERLKKDNDKINEGNTIWTKYTKVDLAKNRRTGDLIYVNFEFKDNNLVPVTRNYQNEWLPPMV